MVFYKSVENGELLSLVNAADVDSIGKVEVVAPNTVDAATEKHVPDVSVDGNVVTVRVGSVAHPMLEEHHISFVALETCCGFQVKYLKVGEEPVAKFVLSDGEKAKAAYEFCNLHGLWKKEI